MNHRYSSVIGFAVLFLAVAAVGCSVVGYAGGSYAGTRLRRNVPSYDWSSQNRRAVWLDLADGRELSGVTCQMTDADSITIEIPTSSGTSLFSSPPSRRLTLARDEITSLEVADTSFRWMGLLLGAMVDVVVISAATSSYPYNPARNAKVGSQ